MLDIQVSNIFPAFLNPSRSYSLTKTVLHVDGGGGTLEDTESLDDGGGHAVLGLVDIEVAQGAIISHPSDQSAILMHHTVSSW